MGTGTSTDPISCWGQVTLIFNNNFIDRVNTHCHLFEKANKKLSVLRNVKLLKCNTLDLLYKITVKSVIDYALPIYASNLEITDLARLDRNWYKAGKLVTGVLHYTSREKL